MNLSDTLVCIGKITKHWGFEHEVFIAVKQGYSLPVKTSEPVFVMIADKPVPFFIRKAAQQGKNGVVVAFYDMSDFLLKSILHHEIFVSIKTSDRKTRPHSLQETLEGYTVHDRHNGYVGVVSHLMERDPQPVLVILHDHKEILIPYTPEIVVKTEHKKRIVRIEAPEGLIDLYLNP